MIDPFDKHKFATQPEYHTKERKIYARSQVIEAYRKITGQQSIPENKGYWTLCNKQPNEPGVEIVQLQEAGLIQKNQFFGVDNDIKNEGIIESNRVAHPDANWFKGDWLEVIADNFETFNPALVHLDYTKTVLKESCHVYVATTMNLCPEGTVVAVNLMLSDGHSSKLFDPKILIEGVRKHIRNPETWVASTQYFQYKSSRTEMGTFIFTRM
jgi:hypothetical protein